MNMWHARIEEAVETLDEADDFDLELVGARHRALNRRVERGRVAAGSEDSDAFHRSLILIVRRRKCFKPDCAVANIHDCSSNNKYRRCPVICRSNGFLCPYNAIVVAAMTIIFAWSKNLPLLFR